VNCTRLVLDLGLERKHLVVLLLSRLAGCLGVALALLGLLVVAGLEFNLWQRTGARAAALPSWLVGKSEAQPSVLSRSSSMKSPPEPLPMYPDGGVI